MRRVAVTGLGVVSPVGNTVSQFWESLLRGKCGIGPISRYDVSGHEVKIAAEVKGFCPLSCFDAAQVKRVELYAQYAVSAAQQAVEDSKITLAIEPERLGVYFGSGIGGAQTYRKEAEKLIKRGPERISPYFIPMIISNMAAGLIAMRYHATGPCLPVVTACATSSHAIGEAYRAVAGGFADAVIAGGAEAGIDPLIMAGFTNCMALSLHEDPLASSLPFDRRRDGFVMGEGAGALVLEEWDRALARDAVIYAEMTGYANTCDAYHITAPQPDAQSSARAISQAADTLCAVSPQELYFCAHGTGTPMNDSVETLAIKRAFGPCAYDLRVSSIKSVTGHMMGAAGAAEAIASILALKSGIVPPTIGYQVPDPTCDLNYVPNFAQKTHPKAALSLSMGFGGHNACLAFSRAKE